MVRVHKIFNQFTKQCDVSSVNTRNKHKLIMPNTRLHRFVNCFMGQCVPFYNKLPLDIQEFSITRSKNYIKQKLYKKGYYTINEYLSDNNPWE